jgi:hypothetical protein
MRRIYDAQFANSSGKKHWHLATFWWIDENGNTGTWTRLAAYNYVLANAKLVYVSENGKTVYVGHRYDKATETKWIQTYSDGYYQDNLVALAERHRQGLPNN